MLQKYFYIFARQLGCPKIVLDRMCACACVCMCVCVYVCVCMCTCVYVCVCTTMLSIHIVLEVHELEMLEYKLQLVHVNS